MAPLGAVTVFSFLIAISVPGPAAPPSDIGPAGSKAMEAKGSFLTDAERAAIKVRVREALNNTDIARTTSWRANEQVQEPIRRLRIERSQIAAARHHRLTDEERERLRSDMARVRVNLQQMREQIRWDIVADLGGHSVH